jgi:hypothetical protein
LIPKSLSCEITAEQPSIIPYSPAVCTIPSSSRGILSKIYQYMCNVQGMLPASGGARMNSAWFFSYGVYNLFWNLGTWRSFSFHYN